MSQTVSKISVSLWIFFKFLLLLNFQIFHLLYGCVYIKRTHAYLYMHVCVNVYMYVENNTCVETRTNGQILNAHLQQCNLDTF